MIELPPYFQRLHELFDRVLELPPEDRDTEIERLTTDAPELAAELRALLEHAERGELLADLGLDAKGIAAACREVAEHGQSVASL